MDIFKQLTSHASVRKFTEQPISDELKQQLIQAAQSGSTSNNIQAYSIIEVKDKEKLEALSQMARGQKSVTTGGAFYVFVADLYRNYQVAQKTNTDFAAFASAENLLVAVVDTTIAAQSMAIYAESQGLGLCYIGGVRNDMDKVAELLDLPPYTVPLFGITMGYPNEQNEVKPRLMPEVIHNVDSYQPLSEDNLQAYDQITTDYYQERTTNSQEANWSKKIQEQFAADRRPQVAAFLKKQGFKL